MDLAERCLVYLSLEKAENDAWVIYRQNAHSEELHAHACMLGEQKETARRRLADKIIKDRPDMEGAIRLVVKFPADQPSTGAAVDASPPVQH